MRHPSSHETAAIHRCRARLDPTPHTAGCPSARAAMFAPHPSHSGHPISLAFTQRSAIEKLTEAQTLNPKSRWRAHLK